MAGLPSLRGRASASELWGQPVPGWSAGGGGQLQPQAVNRPGGRRYKGPQLTRLPEPRGKQAEVSPAGRGGWATRLTTILGRCPPTGPGEALGSAGAQGAQRRQEEEEGAAPREPSLKAAAWPGLQGVGMRPCGEGAWL